MKKTIIEVPRGIRYIGNWEEFNDIFPTEQHIMDKAITGCGFTEWCLTNRRNVVLCSPRNILLDNKAEQHPGEVYRVRSSYYDRELGIDKELPRLERENGEIKKMVIMVDPDETAEVKNIKEDEDKSLYEKISREYDEYSMTRNILPRKILVTYDSFRIVKEVLEDKGILHTFTIIVDEFQSIFTDARFKSNVEINFVEQLSGLPNVCYLSATPMMDKYLEGINEFKDLPYYELDWKTQEEGRIIKPKLLVKLVRSIFEPAKKEINNYLQGKFPTTYRRNEDDNIEVIESKELVFYVNSVTNIVQIINRTGLTPCQVNILCANTAKNQKQIRKALGKDWVIGSVPLMGEPRKMFTFCTRTVYLGADFYSDNARSIILSNSNVECLAVDISLDLPQILGRQRLWENPWKSSADFYYIPLSNKGKMTEEDFNALIEEKLDYTRKKIENWIEAPHKQVATKEIERMIHYANYCNDYVGLGKDRKPRLNELVKIAEQRAFDIQQIDYKDRFSVISSANEVSPDGLSGEVNAFFAVYDGLRSIYSQLKFICEANLSEEAWKMVEDRLPTNIKSFLSLGKDRLRALGYHSTKIMNELTALTKKDKLDKRIYEEFKVGDRLSKADIKNKLSNIYKEYEINKTAKATDLMRWFELKDTDIIQDQKTTKGFRIISTR